MEKYITPICEKSHGTRNFRDKEIQVTSWDENQITNRSKK